MAKLSMTSNRKQKGRERRSIQSVVVSDMENFDVLLGNYSRNKAETQLRGKMGNMGLKSKERQANSNLSGEDFRTLLNINSGGSNENLAKAFRT